MPKKLEKIYKACMASKTYADKSPEAREKICRATAVNVSKQKWKQHSKDASGLFVEEIFFDYPMVITEARLSGNREMEITLLSTTSDHKDKEAMRRYYKNKVGNKILWDHKHPVRTEDGVMIDGELKRYPPFGRITDSWLEDLEIQDDKGDPVLGNYIKGRIYGWSPAHEAFQQMVLEHQKSGEPLGGSDHFYNYLNDNNDLLFQLDEETSITPAPVCEICRITEAKMLSKTKGDNMENDNTPAEVTEPEVTTEKVELSNEVTDEVEAISSDMLQKTIVEMNSIIESQKSKIGEHEKTIEDLTSKMSSISDELSKSKAEVRFLTEKKPLLDEIAEILGPKYENSKDVQEHYKALTPELLKVQIKVLGEADKAAEQIEKVPVENDPTPKDLESDEEKLASGDLLDKATDQLMSIAEQDSLDYIFK